MTIISQLKEDFKNGRPMPDLNEIRAVRDRLMAIFEPTSNILMDWDDLVEDMTIAADPEIKELARKLNNMTEQDYIKVSNRALISSALGIARNVLPGDNYGISAEEHGELIDLLGKVQE